MTRVTIVALLMSSVTLGAQAPSRPADIDPQSLSRLPLVPRASLDANGQRIYDQINGNAQTPRLGPPAASMHSVVVAAPYDELNQLLRRSVITPKYFELCTLVAAREFDSEYEWSGHEPAAVRAGVSAEVIDRVRHDRDTAGLPEKDAVVIQFGRTLFRQHKVDSALYANVVEHFGRQGLVDLTLTLGDYVMTAFLLNAVDQQLQPGRTVNLPPRRSLAAAAQSPAPAQTVVRPPLLFREEWKQPPYTGTLNDENRRVTHAAVTNSKLRLTLYGPDADEIGVYTHEGRFDLWNGMSTSPIAATLKDASSYFDLTGLARLRWTIRTGGLHVIHPVVKLADGTMLAGDHFESTNGDYITTEVAFGNIRWFRLDSKKVVTGPEVKDPDLRRVDEIGWTDLMPGGGHGAAGWVNVSVVELYANAVPR